MKHPLSCLLLVMSTVIAPLGFAQGTRTPNTNTQPISPAGTQNTESNPKSWKEFFSPEGYFSVLLPGTPVQQIQRVDSPAGPRDSVAYTLQTEAHSYFLAFVDFPEVPDDAGGVRKILDGGRDGAIATINGKLISEADLSLKGIPGRAITVEGANEVLKARIYLAELRLYLVMIVAGKNQTPSAETSSLDSTTVEKFLGSFKLISRKKRK